MRRALLLFALAAAGLVAARYVLAAGEDEGDTAARFDPFGLILPAVYSLQNALMSDSLQLSPAGFIALQQHEGLRLAPYQDAAGYWTVGYGHKMGPLDDSTETITTERAAELLRGDVATAADAVNALVAVPLSQSQFDALVSFVYNVGSGAFRGSTLLRVLNGGDYAAAAGEFNRWNRAGGMVLAGLVSRRAEESQRFAQGIA